MSSSITPDIASNQIVPLRFIHHSAKNILGRLWHCGEGGGRGLQKRAKSPWVWITRFGKKLLPKEDSQYLWMYTNIGGSYMLYRTCWYWSCFCCRIPVYHTKSKPANFMNLLTFFTPADRIWKGSVLCIIIDFMPMYLTAVTGVTT